MTPSVFQQNIYDKVEQDDCNIVINAVAGSGKSTTLVELVNRIPKGKRVIFVAFNRDIVRELRDRVPSSVEVKTLHSFGLNECRFKYARNKNNDEFIKDSKVSGHILRHAEQWTEFETKEEKHSYCKNIEKLIDMFRLCLPASPGEVQDLIQKFDIPCYNGEVERAEKVFLDVRADKSCVDYTDMIYFPAVGDWRLKQYDFVLADEVQDFNRAQQTMIRKMVKPGGRLVAVGDKFQAIYGFSGADSDSFDNMKTLLSNTVEMPLSICYRCDRSIVEHAQDIMPTILPRDNAPDGSVRAGSINDVRPGDFVLCRNTRPLVSLCMKYIAQGKKANIKGRDIGANLINMVKGTGMKGVEPCFKKLEKDLDKLREKTRKQYPLRPTDEVPVVGNMIDKIEAIRTIATTYKCNDTDGIFAVINDIFQETSDNDTIVLSTVHKSKGLEADNVFIVDAYLMPAKYASQDWEIEQEKNLMYVARTRAKHNLVYIDDWTCDPTKRKDLDACIACMGLN